VRQYESGGLLFERDMGNGRPAPLYVVADKEGVGAGVLIIKACSPVAGSPHPSWLRFQSLRRSDCSHNLIP
jgi:hypothetical protein